MLGLGVVLGLIALFGNFDVGEPAVAVLEPTLMPTATSTPAPTIPIIGECMAVGDVPLSAGLANLMFLFAPLGMVLGYRRLRKNRDSRGGRKLT